MLLNSSVISVTLYAAPLDIDCFDDFLIDESQSLTRSEEVWRSLPVSVTFTPQIGGLHVMTSNQTHLGLTWSVSGNDPGLILGTAVPITWNVTYNDSMCSAVTGQPGVLTSCLAINLSTVCTTNVTKISKSPWLPDCLCVLR